MGIIKMKVFVNFLLLTVAFCFKDIARIWKYGKERALSDYSKKLAMEVRCPKWECDAIAQNLCVQLENNDLYNGKINNVYDAEQNSCYYFESLELDGMTIKVKLHNEVAKNDEDIKTLAKQQFKEEINFIKVDIEKTDLDYEQLKGKNAEVMKEVGNVGKKKGWDFCEKNSDCESAICACVFSSKEEENSRCKTSVNEEVYEGYYNAMKQEKTEENYEDAFMWYIKSFYGEKLAQLALLVEKDNKELPCIQKFADLNYLATFKDYKGEGGSTLLILIIVVVVVVVAILLVVCLCKKKDDSVAGPDSPDYHKLDQEKKEEVNQAVSKANQ